MIWLIILGFIVLMFGAVVFRGAPYVPSKRAVLERSFRELYPLNSNDLLIDIGSGDGIVLRTAAAYGARAIGYELNPILVGISRILSRNMADQIQTKLADFWRVQLPADTTIVFTFGEGRDIQKMYDKIQIEATRLQKRIHFMSNSFPVPQATREVGHDKSCYLYLIEPLQAVEA